MDEVETDEPEHADLDARLDIFDADSDELRDISYALLMKELGIENYKPYDRNIAVNRITH